MSRKLKLGIVNSSPMHIAYGGVAPFIKNLDPFLKQEFEVTYITLPTYLHDIHFPRRLSFLFYLITKVNFLRKFDVILSHVPEGSFVCSFLSAPFIHIFHGNFNAMSQSRFWFGKYFKNIFNYFEKRILKKALLTYTVGIEREGVPKILNPIFHDIIEKDIEKRSGFVFVGRLEKIKNVNKIIEIYSKLDQSITDENKLFITGKGSQKESLKEQVLNLELEGSVIFKGELSNMALIEFVSNKKLLMMASDQEGLPMAIAESLSVGVPVISTDTGDIARAVQNDFNGQLLPIKFKTEDYIYKLNLILDNYLEYSANALASSNKFQAKEIAINLTNDIQNQLHKINRK